MRKSTLRFLSTALLVAGAFVPAFADEPSDAASSGRELAQAVAKSRMDLQRAVQLGQTEHRVALRAGFAQDTEGRLVLRVLLRSSPDDAAEFEEWTGPATDQWWAARRRILRDEGELSDARRLHELVRMGDQTLAQAITVARGVKREDKTRPGIAISIEPTLEDGELRAVAVVAIDERLHQVTQVLDSGVILSTRPTAAPPSRIEVDTDSETRTMPELSVPGGVWFNAETPPTLASLEGSPVLVEVADPG